MKYFKYITSVFLLVAVAGWMTSCGEDELTGSLEELRNEGFDLVVISDSQPYVPVAFTVKGSGLKKVTVNISNADGEVVATGELNQVKVSSLNRVNFNVPFPSNDIAGSGLYVVNYSYTIGDANKEGGSYEINVLNNRIPAADCAYTSTLPGGKTVWIRVYVPKGETLPENDDDLFVTGSWEGREGGNDWSGGGGGTSIFKMTQINDRCYELALNLVNGDLFKITRGEWPKEIQTADKNNLSNYSYNGESVISFTAFNFGDRPAEDYGLAVPSGAVVPRMMTVVANVTNYDVDEGDYYIVEEGTTSLEGATKMIPFASQNSLAAAVPKEVGVNYVIVKDEIDATGSNAYGFSPTIEWDGETNPVQVPIGSFGDPAFELGNKIVIVGAASPGGWGVSFGQDFTKTAEGVYEITIALFGNSDYLLLPNYNEWDFKWGYGSGNASSGTLSNQGTGGNLNTNGLSDGTYKIVVDFTTGSGTYTVTPVL